jgi:hypothetical protein
MLSFPQSLGNGISTQPSNGKRVDNSVIVFFSERRLYIFRIGADVALFVIDTLRVYSIHNITGRAPPRLYIDWDYIINEIHYIGSKYKGRSV